RSSSSSRPGRRPRRPAAGARRRRAPPAPATGAARARAPPPRWRSAATPRRARRRARTAIPRTRGRDSGRPRCRRRTPAGALPQVPAVAAGPEEAIAGILALVPLDQRQNGGIAFLDGANRRILAELQSDARLTLAELGRRV